jgi:hypothetical protein
MTSQAKYSQTS